MILADALAELPVVAILRGVTPDEVEAHAEVPPAAGVRAVEVPLNSPDPLASVRRLAAAWGDRVAVGAGTALAPDHVVAVADAGGRFVVAPNTDPAVIRRMVGLGLDIAPGFATATEAFAAYAAGARHLKLFPAAPCGAGHLRQLKAVLSPDLTVWAVGGVGPASMADWRAAGAQVFGLGGELYRAGQTVADTAEKAARLAAATTALAR